MTAKEFFKKISDAERRVESATRKVELFKSMAEKITASLDGEQVSHTPNVHSFEDSVLRLSEAKEELNRLTAAYTALVSEISAQMRLLDDPEDEELLTCHYLRHIPLTKVAKEMHRCVAWVYRRHTIALEHLDRILEDYERE